MLAPLGHFYHWEFHTPFIRIICYFDHSVAFTHIIGQNNQVQIPTKIRLFMGIWGRPNWMSTSCSIQSSSVLRSIHVQVFNTHLGVTKTVVKLRLARVQERCWGLDLLMCDSPANKGPETRLCGPLHVQCGITVWKDCSGSCEAVSEVKKGQLMHSSAAYYFSKWGEAYPVHAPNAPEITKDFCEKVDFTLWCFFKDTYRPWREPRVKAVCGDVWVGEDP